LALAPVFRGSWKTTTSGSVKTLPLSFVARVWIVCADDWPGSSVIILKNIFAEKIGVFCSNFWKFFLQKVDHNIGFWEVRQFFRRKLAKMTEISDHNIDPCGQCYIFGTFLPKQIEIMLMVPIKHDTNLPVAKQCKRMASLIPVGKPKSVNRGRFGRRLFLRHSAWAAQL
jgi:hypothetical protein